MRLNVTPAERDDITLALSLWAADLEDPISGKPRSALDRSRRLKARQLDELRARIYMADLIPMPDVP